MKKLIFISCLLLRSVIVNAQQTDLPKLTGPYLGQKPPGTTPEIFAPGIVSTAADEYAFEISPAGDEMLFTRNGTLILITRNHDGTWNKPAVAPFSGQYIDGESCFSPAGDKIYFCSRRPVPEANSIRNVWISEKADGSWGKPYHLDDLNHENSIHAPSVAANGNIYDDGIVRFRFIDGKYLPAENISHLRGGFPFVSPDESYLIFVKREPGTRNSDLYISFQQSDGTWTQSASLGGMINTPALEGNSFVTADGKYLFFSRNFDIYWVDAGIIESLRPRQQDISK